VHVQGRGARIALDSHTTTPWQHAVTHAVKHAVKQAVKLSQIRTVQRVAHRLLCRRLQLLIEAMVQLQIDGRHLRGVDLFVFITRVCSFLCLSSVSMMSE
jgi:hypothetical protein